MVEIIGIINVSLLRSLTPIIHSSQRLKPLATVCRHDVAYRNEASCLLAADKGVSTKYGPSGTGQPFTG